MEVKAWAYNYIALSFDNGPVLLSPYFALFSIYTFIIIYGSWTISFLINDLANVSFNSHDFFICERQINTIYRQKLNCKYATSSHRPQCDCKVYHFELKNNNGNEFEIRFNNEKIFWSQRIGRNFAHWTSYSITKENLLKSSERVHVQLKSKPIYSAYTMNCNIAQKIVIIRV